MQIFKKEYDGGTICQIGMDVFECVIVERNPIVATIPVNMHGMPLGKFIVSVEWEE